LIISNSGKRILAAMIFLLVAVYSATCMLGPDPWLAQFLMGPLPAELMELGARWNERIAQGELFRLSLSMFIHADLNHLLTNAAWVAMLGIPCIAYYGPVGFFALMILGGIGGQMTAFAMSPGPGIGASGGVYALMAGTLIGVWSTPEPPSTHLKIGAVLLALLFVGASFWGVQVDHAAHLGGAFSGLVVAYSLTKMPTCIRWIGPVTCGLLLMTIGQRAVGQEFVWQPVPTTTRTNPRLAPLALPSVGASGRLTGSGCSSGSVRDEPECQVVQGEMLAFIASAQEMVITEPLLAHQIPPPGHCTLNSQHGENVLMYHHPAKRILVMITPSSSWARYAPVARQLTGGQCPGT